MRMTFVRAIALASFVLGGATVFSQTALIQAQWQASPHATTETISEATVEVRQATAGHCGRCHSEQGYVAWSAQLARGDSGQIKGAGGTANATVPELTALGLTKVEVRPIGCNACHTANGGLRFDGATPTLPSGFAMNAVGTGATCATCHNTRNGRVQWNAETKANYTGPHYSAESDVVAGKNFYFINETGDNTLSEHAKFVENSCSTCHMGGPGRTNHSFQVNNRICAQCHGTFLTKDAVGNGVNFLMDQLRASIGRRFIPLAATVTVVRAYNTDTGAFTDNAPLDGKTIQGISEIRTIGGQLAFGVSLANGSTVYSPIAEFREAAGGKQVVSSNDMIVRAAWNYMMVKYDGSEGVHNPNFVRDALNATIAALRQ
jgi:hypothetical protein